MPTVVFGVTKALEPYKPDEGSNEIRVRKLSGNREVEFFFPNPTPLKDGSPDPTGWTFQKYLGFVTSEMPNRSDGPPAWVISDNKGLAQALASEHGCRIGRPKNWKVEA